MCFLLGCEDNGPTNGDPAFSNVTGISSNLYVTYQSPLPGVKLDTMTVTFTYNSSKVSSILVQATIDAGGTWATCTTITPSSSNSATVKWVPMDEDSAFKYFFGVKTGKLKISDPGSGESIESGNFSLAGLTPIKLIAPLGGETYSINDTIKVQYSANMDILSQILTFFRTDNMSEWAEFINDILLPSPNPPVSNYIKWFVPSQVDASILKQTNNFEQPIRILVQDYSNRDAEILTGYITITQ
ncbi:MAG: hypothetical protein JW768_12770 [Chitinispirillaceae bacterium]|nr:hypothetical protein [Chitinispirillaceae bacterium]